MKHIYSKHQTGNGMDYSYYDEDFYLCETEEEYEEQRKKYEARHTSAKADYARRGCASFTPELSPERKITAREYYYGHEWRGRNFEAVGFSWTKRDSRGSATEHILKAGSVINESRADNRGCVGWMYGS